MRPAYGTPSIAASSMLRAAACCQAANNPAALPLGSTALKNDSRTSFALLRMCLAPHGSQASTDATSLHNR